MDDARRRWKAKWKTEAAKRASTGALFTIALSPQIFHLIHNCIKMPSSAQWICDSCKLEGMAASSNMQSQFYYMIWHLASFVTSRYPPSNLQLKTRQNPFPVVRINSLRMMLLPIYNQVGCPAGGRGLDKRQPIWDLQFFSSVMTNIT